MRRVLAIAAIVVVGLLSLPLAALPVPDEGDKVIALVALVGAGVFGAIVALAVPSAFAGQDPRGFDREPDQRALIGAALGVAASVVGIGFFWVVLGVDAAPAPERLSYGGRDYHRSLAPAALPTDAASAGTTRGGATILTEPGRSPYAPTVIWVRDGDTTWSYELAGGP